MRKYRRDHGWLTPPRIPWAHPSQVFELIFKENEELVARLRNLLVQLCPLSRWTRRKLYESFSDVGESWVWWRADFQSGSRVLKKVLWTFSYLYLLHTMWFYAEKLLKTLKFWKSLNSLCKSGSRPQKSSKKAQKRITQSRFTQIFE